MALMSIATLPTFFRVGEFDSGFTGANIFGTGFTYGIDPDTGLMVPITGTITSIQFSLNGVTLVAMRDLPVDSVPALSGAIGSILWTLAATDPSDAFYAVLTDFEGATFVDIGIEDLGGSDVSNDVLQASADGALFGLGGNDALYGGSGSNGLIGGFGEDSIFGGAGEDFITGEQGNDFINAGAGNDLIFFLEDADVVRAGAGDDFVFANDPMVSFGGTSGDDVVFGGTGNDTLILSNGNDKIFGGANDDQVYTGDGRDIARGGAGNDLIAFGSGQNQIFGGDDADVFLFEGAEVFEASGASRNLGDISTIRDFDAFEDVIVQTAIEYTSGLDPSAAFAAFVSQSTEVGDDVLWTSSSTGQRVLIKDLTLAELSSDNFDFGVPLVAF